MSKKLTWPEAIELARASGQRVEEMLYPPSPDVDGWAEALRNTRESGQRMRELNQLIGIPCE